MTLVRANEYFDSWNEQPPVFLTVRGIFEGLGGKFLPDEPGEDYDRVGRLLSDFAREIPAQTVPIVRGVDEGLPKEAPIFDLDDMRRKNFARKNKMRKVGNAI